MYYRMSRIIIPYAIITTLAIKLIPYNIIHQESLAIVLILYHLLTIGTSDYLILRLLLILLIGLITTKDYSRKH